MSNTQEIRLYTPNHNPFTDALITYGIIGSIADIEYELTEKINVRSVGNYYEITLRNMSLKDLAHIISLSTKNHINSIAQRLIDEGGVIQKQSRRKLMSVLKVLTNYEFLENALNDLRIPNHSLRNGEGRKRPSKRGRKISGPFHNLDTIWLALMPIAGKFRTSLFNVTVQPYMACILCRGLATIGLYHLGILASGVFRHENNKVELVAFELIPVFEGEVSGDVIALYSQVLSRGFNELYESIRTSLDVLPLPILSKFLIVKLTTIEGGAELIKKLFNSKASWSLISLRFSRGASRLSGYDILRLDPLLTGLYLIIKREIVTDMCTILTEAVKRLIKRKKSKYSKAQQIKVDVDTVSYIIKYLEKRTTLDLYYALRSIYRDEGIREFLDVELAKSLAKIIGA